MTDHINVIADDYGLSAGVGSAIRDLIKRGKITGTGCMTLFPEWQDQAALLRTSEAGSRAEIGLHLTLTDFPPVSRPGEPPMPSLGALVASSVFGRLDQATVDRELDAQLHRFVDGIGRLPDFIDGHQHVHFLPAVRRWLERSRSDLRLGDRLPWLRGAPTLRVRAGSAIRAKIAAVRALASGFDRRMKAAGYPVRGPLIGFYDWTRPSQFRSVILQLEEGLPAGTVVMCHPGQIDHVLVSRNTMVEARPVEFEALARTAIAQPPDLRFSNRRLFEA